MNWPRKPAGAGVGGGRERGAAALDLAVWVIGWATAVALVAAAFQYQSSRDAVADAAAQAARAASLTATAPDAIQVARTTATTRLATGTCEAGSVAVRVQAGSFQAGASITVTVSCRTNPPIGFTRTLTATSDDIIDRYRGGL